jgi:hypothetical protein
MSEMPTSVQGQACCPESGTMGRSTGGRGCIGRGRGKSLPDAGGTADCVSALSLPADGRDERGRHFDCGLAVRTTAGARAERDGFSAECLWIDSGCFPCVERMVGSDGVPDGFVGCGNCSAAKPGAFSDDNGAFRREYYRRCRPDALVEPWLSGAGAAGSAGSSRGFFADRFRTTAKRPWGLRNSATEAPSA